MSFRPSLRMEQLRSHQKDFMEFDIWGYFEDLSREFKLY
jgi:hypothetical protein